MVLRLFGSGKPEPADKVIRIEGLDRFRKAIKHASGPEAVEALKRVNVSIAEMIVERTKPKMAKRSERSAASLRAAKTANGAYVYGGGARAPHFGGVEFGAYHDRRRLIKHPYKGEGKSARRARATIVRDGENIDKIKRKVESQFVTSTGKTVSSREGGTQVRVKQIRLGWNMFDEWKGNGAHAGYFLYDTVRWSSQEITDTYMRAMIEIARDAFPDGKVA